MSEWLDASSHWLASNPQWLGLALLLTCFAECLAIVGLLLPGTFLLFSISTLAGNGVLSLSTTLLLAFIGGLLGDVVSYVLGRRYHQAIRQLPLLRTHPQWLLSAELYFHKYGSMSLIIGRFIGPLRPTLPLTAGMLDMPFGRFCLVSLWASAGWALAYSLPGWATGAAIHLPLPKGFWTETAILVGTLITLLGACCYCTLHGGPERVAALISGFCAACLLALLLGWPYLAEFDQGLMSIVQQARTPALDQLMGFVTRLGDYINQLTACLLLIALLLLCKQPRPALFAGLVFFGTSLTNVVTKHAFARLRPEILLQPFDSYSFPSSHSASAFALFLLLGTLAGRAQPPRVRMIWLLLAGLSASVIAASRVYLGAHWPTDVIGGALLAATFCAASLAFLQRQQALAPLPARVWSWLLPLCLGWLAAYASWMIATNADRYLYEAG